MLPLLTLSALPVPVTKGQWQENSLINISRIISKGERLKDAGCAINTPSWPLGLLLHSPETANSNDGWSLYDNEYFLLHQDQCNSTGEKSQPVTEEQVCEPDAVRPHKPKHRSLQPGKVYCSVT